MADNPMLRQQALTIMQQIEALKSWHKEQQDKIKGTSSEESLTQDSKPKHEETSRGTKQCEDVQNKTPASFSCKMNGRNQRSNHVVNIDEIPIKLPNQNLKELVENNIKSNNVDLNVNQNSDVKPKRKFLKRGEGIARFRMGPAKPIKSKTKNHQTTSLSLSSVPHESKHSSNENAGYVKSASETEEIPENIEDYNKLKPPPLKLELPNLWKTLLNSESAKESGRDTSEFNLDLLNPNTSIDSVTASFMEKVIAVGKRHIKETEELRVFEQLELYAADSSFCSTSSYVTKLMENSVKSTPIKNKTPSPIVRNPSCNTHNPSPIRHNAQVHLPGNSEAVCNIQSPLPFSNEPFHNIQTASSINYDLLNSTQNHSQINNMPLYNTHSPSLTNTESLNLALNTSPVSSRTSSNRNEADQGSQELYNLLTKQLTGLPFQKESIKPSLEHDVSNSNCGNTSTEVQNATQSDTELEQSRHVQFADQNSYRSYVEYSQSTNNSNPTEGCMEQYFDDDQEWSDADCSCHCSTEYSSSDEDVRPISPPGASPCEHLNTKCHSNATHFNTRKNITNCSEQIKQIIEEKQEPVVDRGLKFANKMEKPAETATEIQDENLSAQDCLLRSKVKELEEEIEIFRSENTKLKNVRTKMEAEYKDLQKDKRKLLKDVEDEKKKNAALLAEEKQKLAKEKLVFEKYSRTIRKNPNKEERKEIQALRDQLTEMKEELNKKESRWGAAQARVRNQVKLLEEDNKKLKEEIEGIRKQARQLQSLASKKRGGKSVSNTKLIHAINEQISNIDSEKMEDERMPNVGGNYFQVNSEPLKTVVLQDVSSDVSPKENVRVIKESTRELKQVRFQSDNSVGRLKDKSDNINKEQTLENSYFRSSYDQTSHLTNTSRTASEKMSTEEHESNQENIQNNQDGIGSLIGNVHPDSSFSRVIRECIVEEGNVEKMFADGRKEVWYKNGNVKKLDPNNESIKMIYFNGDVKENTKDGTVKYYFAESRIWHTTFPDGLEVLDFANGQVEKRHKNGLIEIIYPNDCRRLTHPDGSEELFYADGTIVKIDQNQQKVLTLPNGQKEIHTKEHIRREYPDGTIKIVYPDGVQETIYSNGRIRLKDKDGNLVMDSGQQC